MRTAYVMEQKAIMERLNPPGRACDILHFSQAHSTETERFSTIRFYAVVPVMSE